MDWLADITDWLSLRISDITDWVSFHIISTIIIVLTLLGISIGGGLLLLHKNNSHQSSSATTTTTTVYPLQQIPTPDSARAKYTNTKYRYSFVYPSEWKAYETQFNNVNIVTVSYQVQTGPDVRLLAVNCTANSSKWDAQTWWQHNPTGVQIGFTLLESGERAFVSVTSNQQAEQGYTQYIVVHNYTACWLTASTANAANETLINGIINTFHWN